MKDLVSYSRISQRSIWKLHEVISLYRLLRKESKQCDNVIQNHSFAFYEVIILQYALSAARVIAVADVIKILSASHHRWIR